MKENLSVIQRYQAEFEGEAKSICTRLANRINEEYGTQLKVRPGTMPISQFLSPGHHGAAFVLSHERRGFDALRRGHWQHLMEIVFTSTEEKSTYIVNCMAEESRDIYRPLPSQRTQQNGKIPPLTEQDLNMFVMSQLATGKFQPPGNKHMLAPPEPN